MGAVRKKKKLSHLIPKNHFCSFSLFRQEPLISWTYTKAVLFTAYDIYKSTDFWLDEIINSGKTLKEGLVELGFPKDNTLVADTGVFEMEAKKAGIARNLGIEVDIELTNNQIFEAYKLSGADYFVAPDEIILPQDSQTEIITKIGKIKDNLLELLEVVHASKVIAVIQGNSEEVISDIYDFHREQGISYFAMGGVIPLYFHSKDLLDSVLRYVRDLTKNHWLHIFGLPRISLLQYYLHDIGIDSVDTSSLLYLTARRRYLVGSKGIQVREAVFKDCICEGCNNLNPKESTRSSDFFVNLYIHNILAAVKLGDNFASHNLEESNTDTKIENSQDSETVQQKQESKSSDIVQTENIALTWMTAEESLAIRMRDGENETFPDSQN